MKDKNKKKEKAIVKNIHSDICPSMEQISEVPLTRKSHFMDKEKDYPKSLGVIIIESLSEDYAQTGEKLYKELLKYKSFQEPNLSNVFYKVSNLEELKTVFEGILHKVTEESFFPILHIEMHGDEESIILSSGEEMPWDKLFEYTRPINVHLKNKLILLMGMCYGSTSLVKLNPDKRAPFLVVLGTFKKIGERYLLAAFETFYDHYLFSFDLVNSVNKMNEAAGGAKPLFHLTKSEHWCGKLVNPDTNKENFTRIVNQFAVKEKSLPLMKHVPFDMVKKNVDKKLRKIFAESQANQDYFNMKDLE